MRILSIAERDDRVHRRCAPRRQIRGGEGDDAEYDWHSCERQRIVDVRLEQRSLQQSRGGYRSDCADAKTDRYQRHAFTNGETQHAVWLRPQREADGAGVSGTGAILRLGKYIRVTKVKETDVPANLSPSGAVPIPAWDRVCTSGSIRQPWHHAYLSPG
jgi:hypothetical protein